MARSPRRAALPLLLLLLVPLAGQARDFGGGGGGFRGGGFSGGGGGGGYRFSGGGGDFRPESFAAPAPRPAPAYSPPVRDVAPAPRPAAAPRPEAPVARPQAPVDRALDQGYRGSHPTYGGGTRTPWTGHNVSLQQWHQGAASGFRSFAGRDGTLNRDNGLAVAADRNFYNRSWQGWTPSWSNGGYWGSRPWTYGWYNWTPNSWGWWSSSAVGWGLAGLATGAVITDLVDAAAQQQSPMIDVPDSSYQLNYGSVDAVGDAGADFSYAVADSPPVKGAANCQDGLLDGQVPATAAQAQLLNAACQVAYGPDPKGSPLPASSTAKGLPAWAGAALTLLLGLGLGVGGYSLWRRRHPA